MSALRRLGLGIIATVVGYAPVPVAVYLTTAFVNATFDVFSLPPETRLGMVFFGAFALLVWVPLVEFGLRRAVTDAICEWLELAA